MNAPTIIDKRPALKLAVPYFKMLEGFGAFTGYWKVELLDGKLWGVPADGDFEPESDATVRIKLTVEDYELLDRAGAFDRHLRTELIDGHVYAMSPQHRPHGYVKDEIAYRLRRALENIGSPLRVATEQSVSLPQFSEPQPDIILTTQARGEGPIPGGSVAMLVEVADSSSKFDRVRKAPIYAASDIAEYWILDVNRRVVLRMWNPERGSYTQQDTLTFGAQVGAATMDGLAISTDDL